MGNSVGRSAWSANRPRDPVSFFQNHYRMTAVAKPVYLDTMSAAVSQSSRSSMSETVCGSESDMPPVLNQPLKGEKSKKPKKPKANKQPGQKKQQQQQQKPPKVDKPFYQSLGDELLRSTRLHLEPITMPLPKLPPMPIDVHDPPLPSPMSEKVDMFACSTLADSDYMKRSKSATSLTLSRRSGESNFSDVTKVIRDAEQPSIKYKVKGAIYSLQDLNSLAATEDLILRYGRVAHMGVRDHSYKFWMNSTRTAVVHFKVLNKVAVMGGDPLCHPDRVALSIKEFEHYCKKVGWKTAVIGGSGQFAAIAREKGWTVMNFGTECVLNPQTNEVLLGKAGKRITTQCRQLLDPARGGHTIHTYNPSVGRDPILEADLRTIYDDWRNERNTTRALQSFVTVFDLFAMPKLMTFLYTRDKDGKVNGFAALRKLGAMDGYHIDPFIQDAGAPRGVSDLLIYASMAFLNAQGCSYLSLGYEPVTELTEISGMPSILQTTTRKVYHHVFGKIPIGGKEAFFARWKPDVAQEQSLYLVFVGKMPSPRYMLAMSHFANISLRRILASDWHNFVSAKKKKQQQQHGEAGESSSPTTESTTTTTTPASATGTEADAETEKESMELPQRPKTAAATVRATTKFPSREVPMLTRPVTSVGGPRPRSPS